MVEIDMAIFIPKKNIYEEDIEKIRDNVIERIEVGAVEVVPDNDYETPVYNEDFLVGQLTLTPKNTLNREIVGEAITMGADAGINAVWVANAEISNQEILNKRITIPKVKENKWIYSLLYEKDKDGKNQIKYTIHGNIQKGSCSQSVSWKLPDGLLINPIKPNFTNIGDIVFNTATEEDTGKTFDYYSNITSSYKGTPHSTFYEREIFATLKPNDISNVISFQDNENEFIISIDIMASIIVSKLGGSSYGGGVGGTFDITGTYEKYIPTEIEITVYGNTIGIDLTDKTVYINGETAKKVHSVDGNELMQTSNYYSEDNGETNENAIEKAFTNTLNEYKNGKETLTFRCDINNYYDQSGYKEISLTPRTKLPDGYTEYKKIYLNHIIGIPKNSYIDTGVVANEQTAFQIEYGYLGSFSSINGQFGSIFGARQASSNNEVNLSSFVTGTYTNGIVRYGNKTYGANMQYNIATYTKIADYQYTYAHSGTLPTTTSLEEVYFNTKQTITIGAVNDSGQGVVQFADMWLSSFKILQDGQLIREFIPCRSNSGSFGLFDLVNKKFYKVYGTNARFDVSDKVEEKEEYISPKMVFSVGDQVIPLFQNSNDNENKKYKFIEYIESTGTQFIDTGIPADNNVKIEAKFQATNRLTANYLFGARSSGSANIINLVASNNVQWYARYGKSSSASIPTNDFNIHTIKMSNEAVYFDEQYNYSPNSDSFNIKNNIYIFGVNENGTFNGGYCRIYSFKIYQNEMLVRDFKPCYRVEDGIFGLFDVVNNKFYKNDNSDEINFKELFKIYRVNGVKIFYDGAVWQELSLQEI